MKLRPLGDRVIVRMVELQRRTSPAGIVLPGTMTGQSALRAEVVAVGSDDPAGVKKGDVVLVPRAVGTEFLRGRQRLLILRATDILGVVSPS